ncbi:LacI family DNA-binding transcriptional regulator [Actinobacillus arthritidis]|uniref:LacI family DNA-binding transcriptional regulator n=1 Tax=Actinobacillus arthritidis TaxID=157339 RepID=UPI002441E854|nr:LacI family DNA-binding transcriptional regulator [Actinobacillus arthritidis]WGE89095.1 LacI family transcriptional regulator [Actinobacillus arthritidis]
MANESTRTRKTSGRITLADVAKFVGVGQMTVSRALRTPEAVSEPLRKKIEQAVVELGYVPNVVARQLASASSQNLVIVTSSITSTENNLILSALRQSLAKLELQIVILVADQPSWLQELINHTPQAIVLLNLDCPLNAAEWIKKSHIPTVEIGHKKSTPIDMSVGIDSKVAMKTMIDFLVDKGHRQIGLLAAKHDLSIFQHYLESWRTTLLSKHLDPQLVRYATDDISFSSGVQLFNDAYLEWGNIDALVFLSDELACGALYEALRRHISVPKDIAVVGLGGLDVGSVSYPNLTTIAIPYEQMGKVAGKQLLARLTQETVTEKDRIVELPIKLLIRNSV